MAGKYLFTGGYVATMDDSLGDFPNGAVLVEDGLITAVGRAEDIKSPDAEIIDTTDGVLIPGMVDTHRHASMSLTRGLGADQSLFHFLSNTYLRWLPATSVPDMELSSYVGALEALDSGVTTIVDTCESFHSGEHAEAELRGLHKSGIRAFFCFAMSDDAYGSAAVGMDGWKARLAHVGELKSKTPSDALVQIGMALSQPGTVPFDLTRTELKFADEHALFCCSHSCAIENSIITKDIEERAQHGLMMPGHLYIHCTNLTKREIGLIARSQGKVSIATETEMQMGMGVPPIRACIEHGIQPSLSIDTSSAVAPDLLSQMRLALQMQRCFDNDAVHRTRQVPLELDFGVRDALRWGTRNGAEAVGMLDRIGTLTPGKQADVVLISSKRALSASAYPLATAVLHSSPADVDTVMVKGEVRKRDGHLVGHDIADIRLKAKAGLQRIMENVERMRPEMTIEGIRQYLLDAENLTRSNLAKAHFGEKTRGDWMRQR
ncbi:Metallo-dependent hydrolase [Aspergillus fijiensis CBS 313.89]|uniref:Metallo-dependent hydrolase n=1 Tax=Aspergillus fijiensis CBS 313.89 TaxID=1448319 RepID=A0A8G1RZ28_9EURO|nr:Metallo-dependent hydrolase [Aspergillus fijiensis CBS 313.89]RAK81372.1 Metallo-dependent hydrolase [Aspergillus fijiensis CBS 313.89]